MVGTPFRFGLVGAGTLGTVHARTLSGDARADLVAVADVSDGALSDAGSAFGLSDGALFRDHGSMFDAADLDAVVIATPHALHYEGIVAALEAGLHVLCEKPLVVDLDRAADLVRRGERTDRLLVPGYQRRFWEPYVRAREWWRDAGDDPTHVDLSITQDWGAPGTWRTDPDLSGGGMLYDTGGHLLDYLLWTVGSRPERVSAEASFLDDDRRVDVSASLLIAFEDGTAATISADGDVGEVHERIAVAGPDASIVVEGDGWTDRTVRVSVGDRRMTLETERTTNPTTEGFVDLLAGGGDPPIAPYDAYAVSAVVEAAYGSARSNEVAPVEMEARADLVG